MEAPLIILIIFAVMIGCRLVAGQWNHERIRRHIEGNGGTVERIIWEPFGPGWFGEKSDVIYNVRYKDRHGGLHEAFCKTSMLSGVYFTQDVVIHAPIKPDESSRTVLPEESGAPVTRGSTAETETGRTVFLEEELRRLHKENERLREENERLKREKYR